MKLEINNLSFKYGKKEILKDISFNANSGEIISILGPNGVGKTTLLKCISSILKPDTGSIFLDGNDILSMNSRKRACLLSYVPQAASTSRTTVFDTVLLGRRPHMKAMVSPEDISITSQVIEEMGLSDLAIRYIDQISGGELQKVHIARAITQQASVVVLDEPSNNLDLANQHLIMRILRETVSSKNISVIMTIHDINLALQYSDRFLYIEDGKSVTINNVESITSDLIKDIYGVMAEVITHKGRLLVIPK